MRRFHFGRPNFAIHSASSAEDSEAVITIVRGPEDADRLFEAIASLAPGGPVTLDLTGVTSIHEGGVVAIRRAATKAHDIGGVLVLLLPPSETLGQIRGSGLDEEPLILIEVLET